MPAQVAEAARAAGIKRIWYASSACIYPESKQTDENLDGASGLKEDDAWPAQPQDAYGLEKLMTEELLMHYDADFGMEARIGRFHNIYGPCGTWKGGREKAPAATAPTSPYPAATPSSCSTPSSYATP